MKKAFSLILSLVLVLPLIFISPKAKAASTEKSGGVVSVSSGYLNVRAAASTSSGVVATLLGGDYITLIEKSGDFWRVEYDYGRYGYCHKNYIREVESYEAYANIQSGTLNVRSGASTSNSVIGRLYRNEKVVVIGSSGDFKRVIYNGRKTGFVASRYLAASSSSSEGYKAISLSVPLYLQTDSRWANVKIGSSGKTIGEIGCVTTGIAMMESYRQGKTIYPDAMSKKLSYSSSGNVYWPSDYKQVTSSSGYLEVIYNKLKEGKPVLIGFKKASGSQHWVVITGYNGSGSLTPSSFLINDPATKSRTNLQQFINYYPNFYKFLYY